MRTGLGNLRFEFDVLDNGLLLCVHQQHPTWLKSTLKSYFGWIYVVYANLSKNNLIKQIISN